MKKHIIDLIQNLSDERLTTVSRIISDKYNGKKLICIGNKFRAELISQYLGKFQVEVDKYCVNDEYWDENLKGLYGKEVIPFSRLSAEKNFVLIMGFQNYKRAMEIKSELEGIQTYYIDDPHVLYAMDYEWVLKNQVLLEETYHLLEDDYSKDVLVAFIHTRLSGNPKEIYELRTGDDGQYDYTLLRLGKQETMVDCGGYTGDTIEDFLEFTGGGV